MRIQKPADLARAVKTRRQAQGLTQQDIAEAVGITRQSLARIERGHGGASFDTVLRVFAELGIRLEATSDDQHPITLPIPNDDPLRQATSAALAATRDIHTSSLSLLNAAIEAGDPDRVDSTAAEGVRSRGPSDGMGNG